MIAKNAMGFTLFETLVATMIFATALVVILQLFSGGLRANVVSDQYTRAVYHAREKMETILLADDLTQEPLAGDWDDGFSWKVEIARQDEVVDTATKNIPVPFRLHLEISWKEGTKQREIAISTIALREGVADQKDEAPE